MSAILLKIKNLFSFNKKSNFSYERKRIRPARDWRVIFVLSLVVVSLLAGVSFYFFSQIDAGKLFVINTDETDGEIKVNSTLLKKVVDDLNNRESFFKEVESGVGVPADPSL